MVLGKGLGKGLKNSGWGKVWKIQVFGLHSAVKLAGAVSLSKNPKIPAQDILQVA